MLFLADAKKRSFAFLIFLFVVFGIISTGVSSLAFAGEFTLANAGFARGGILFSKFPFFAGETVRVYAVLFNGSGEDLSGTVEFYDNSRAFGRADFTVKGGGTVREVWADFNMVAGDHLITAKIVGAQASLPGGKSYVVELDSAEAGEARLAVDSDTDGDGVGDKEDQDIDDDSIPNDEEIKLGLDPYKKDTNGDGVSDFEERKLIMGRAAVKSSEISSSTSAIEKQIGEFIGATTTAEIAGILGGAAAKIDETRAAAREWAEAKSDVLRAKLASERDTSIILPAGQTGDPSKIRNGVRETSLVFRPLTVAYEWLMIALAFILANRWLTYLGLSSVLYFILKILYKWVGR